MCRLVSEYGRVCIRRKLRVSECTRSKVLSCLMYGNGGRIHVTLNGELLLEVDCLKYLGSEMAAADGGCERDVIHRMNEGYRAWGALKSVPSNRRLVIKDKKCLYEGVILIATLKTTYICTCMLH